MTTETITTTRRCIGSSRFGIEAHDADPADFPAQPSRRMGSGGCASPTGAQYTNALRKAAVARKAETASEAPPPEPEPEVIEAPDEAPEPEASAPRKTRRAKAESEEEAATE